MEILNKALARIKPAKEEREQTEKKVQDFIKKLNPKLKKAEAILGGSGAKDTWLSGNYDIDIFVHFDYKEYKERSDKLSDILEKALKSAFGKIDRLHGSRDYFQIRLDKYTFEVIPILKIKSEKEALNITDISPLHVKWVKRFPKLSDDIRLLKQFCKANSVYGAESYIRGFSGYDCEILAIYYKGFLNLAKAAEKWKEREVIDPEKYYKNEREVMMTINTSKLVSPLTIVDPVQKSRNVSAALSKEKYDLFKIACKKFLKNPSEDFFTAKEITADELKRKAGANKLILLEAEPDEGKVDVIGSKLLKAFEFIGKKFSDNDFGIVNQGWKWNKSKNALLWYIIETKELPEFVKWGGPPIKAKQFAESFRKAHKNEKVFEEKGRLFANVKRKFRMPEDLAKDAIKDEWLKDKAKKIRIV